MIKATVVDDFGVTVFEMIELPTIPRVGEYFGFFNSKDTGFSTPVLKVEHRFNKVSTTTGHYIPVFEKVVLTVRWN